MGIKVDLIDRICLLRVVVQSQAACLKSCISTSIYALLKTIVILECVKGHGLSKVEHCFY